MSSNRAVYLVDSDASCRRSLAVALRRQGMEIRAFASENRLIEVAACLPAGCVLLAVRENEQAERGNVRRLLAWRPDMPVIVMRIAPTIQEAVQDLRAGAIDCLALPSPMPKMRAALDYAFQILPDKISDQQCIGEAAALRARLTRREEDVLKGLLAGMTNREIAGHLDIGVRTVEMHRANLMHKMRADNLVSLLRVAVLAGITISREDAA